MNLKLWHIIVSTTLQVRLLLDSALPSQLIEAKAGAPAPPLGAAVRSRLRAELLTKLSELRTSLRGLLSDKEAGLVLLPLVIHIDELVMRRLSQEEQTQWLLLQRELFDLQNGGEVFFAFISERLDMPDTPPLLFHVLYFCLSDGFGGKYADEPARLEQYKRQLVERMSVPELPAAPVRKRRGKEDAEPQLDGPPARTSLFYVTAAICVFILIGLTALFTNL